VKNISKSDPKENERKKTEKLLNFDKKPLYIT